MNFPRFTGVNNHSDAYVQRLDLNSCYLSSANLLEKILLDHCGSVCLRHDGVFDVRTDLLPLSQASD